MITVLDKKYENFEVNGFLENTFDNFILIPILNNLPKKLKKYVKKTHESAGEIVENVTNHIALENLYKKGKKHKSKNLLQKFFKWIWFNTDNSKAVRNRLKVVEKEIKSISKILSDKQRSLNFMSIASGSSRAFIKTVITKKEINSEINMTFLDKNPDAIAYSKSLINSLEKKSDNVTVNYEIGNANSFLEKLEKKQDLIEMVGLLDYFDDEQFVRTVKNIYDRLNYGGFSIIANINKNREIPFIENFLDWHMIYRTPEEIEALIEKAGIKEDMFDILVEPMKIHSIAIIRK